MPVPTSLILPLLGSVRDRLDGDQALAALARRARRSPGELHRAIRRVAGETPKRYTTRLRVEHAAAQLVLGRRPILEIALASGFASHEVFTRAFLREFGMSPRAYRARGLIGRAARAIALRHAAVVAEAGPCIALHHLATTDKEPDMSIEIVRKELAPQRALVIRRKTELAKIAATLGECLPKVWAYAQKNGIPLAGQPFTRYTEVGRGLVAIEAGLPINADARGEADVVAVELPGGPAAVAIHTGGYEQLHVTHAAIERWLDDRKLGRRGAPWEVYVTDPATTPNASEWKTEVIYPFG